MISDDENPDIDTSFEEPQGKKLLVIPDSPDQFPESHDDLNAEATAMQKNPSHWAEVKPILDAMAAGTPLNGGGDWDHKWLIFKFQAAAQKNGYVGLAKADAKAISRAFTTGFKRNTGLSLVAVRKQGNQLRIERQKQLKDLRPAAE